LVQIVGPKVQKLASFLTRLFQIGAVEFGLPDDQPSEDFRRGYGLGFIVEQIVKVRPFGRSCSLVGGNKINV